MDGVTPCCFKPFIIDYERYFNNGSIDYDNQLKKLRTKILGGDYRQCPPHCHVRINGELAQKKSLFRPVVDYSQQVASWRADRKQLRRSSIPIRLVAAFEDSCNYACSMCRSKIKGNTLSPTMIKQIWAEFTDKSPSVKNLSFGGSGEPFVQPLLLSFLETLTLDECKKLESISIVTNGSRLSLRTMKQWPIFLLIKWHIQVSLDAATADIYRQVRGQNNFDQILQELTLISKEANIILTISFVIQECNFHQLPDFIKMGKKLNAKVLVGEIRNVPNHKAIHRKKHPRHQELIKVLKTIGMNDDDIYMTSLAKIINAD